MTCLPIGVAALTSVIIGITMFLWRVARRTLRAICAFTGDVLTDVLRAVKRPTSGQERGLRTLSRASLLSLIFLALAGIILFLLNIDSISTLVTRFTPRLSIVTNVLDLISLILITPKFFTIEARDNVRDVSVQMLRSFTINKINIPRTTITSIVFGAVVVSLLVLSLLVLAYDQSYGTAQFIGLAEALNKIYPSSSFAYIIKHVIGIQRVYMKIWPFLIATTIITIVLAVSIILLAHLPNSRQRIRKNWKITFLFWGLCCLLIRVLCQ